MKMYNKLKTHCLEILTEIILVFFRYCSPWWPRIKKLLLNCLCDSLWSNSRCNKPKSLEKLL